MPSTAELALEFEAAGRCMDVDAHEMVPVHMWRETFGEGAARFLDLCGDMAFLKGAGANSPWQEDLEGDFAAITPDNVWQLKGCGAPSAIDLGRRVAVLDAMGIERQLIFPGFALAGVIIRHHPHPERVLRGFDPSGIDPIEISDAILHSHNDFCIRASAVSDRLRPVGLLDSPTVEGLMSTLKHLISGGVRAVMVPSGVPPAGLSPADAALDEFWGLLAGERVTVLHHVGTEFGLLASHAWGANVPAFASAKEASIEFPLQPQWGATLHHATENYLTAMILGGVFERHPTLRFGAIEVGAQWAGPLAERLDMWAKEFERRLAGVISRPPSFYINRNVRVAPFSFEDIALYFRRYPTVANVFCYSSDFPHREGGRNSKRAFFEKLADLPQSIRDDFFFNNGELLLPE